MIAVSHPYTKFWLLSMGLIQGLFSQAQFAKTTQFSSGGILSTNGFGIVVQAHLTDNDEKKSHHVSGYLHTIKHAQESRIKNDKYVNPNPYVFGKINAGGGIGLDYTFLNLIGEKNNKTPSLYWGTSLGPMLGIIKPYYISYDKRGEQNLVVVQDEYIMANQDSIIGGVSWIKGINEMKYTPGIHIDLHVVIEWTQYLTIHRWQNGVRMNYFPKNLTILYQAKNALFLSFYTQYTLGKNT